jgi:hypothetical protein
MAFPTTSILDSFTGADENPIATNWSGGVHSSDDQMRRLSNTLRGQPQANASGYWDLATFGPDCEVYLTITTQLNIDGDKVLLYLRGTDFGTTTPDGYEVRLIFHPAGTDVVQVYEVTDNNRTQLGADISQNFADGDALGASVIGSTITVYRLPSGGAWTSLGTRTDGTHTGAGRLGITITDSNAPTVVGVFDQFGGGTAVLSQILLPDGDLAAGGWTTAPLYSKLADGSDATIITATAS